MITYRLLAGRREPEAGVPLFDPGQVNAHWSETVVSWALPAAAWMVADSYRGMPWLAASHTAVGRDAL